MDGKYRYTRSFALTIFDLLRFGAIKDVANFLHVGWDVVKNIYKSKLQRFIKGCLFEVNPKPLIKVGLTLLKHMNGILNYFSHRITSGSVEGTVNKIKKLKRQAYGFRDMDYF